MKKIALKSWKTLFAVVICVLIMTLSIASVSSSATENLKDGMCFTIEPGLYNSKYFGIRLENSVANILKKVNKFQ